MPRVVTYEQPERLAEALTGADCVVHLAGILFESRTTNYRTGNVESTRALVAAARSAGVRHVVLVSLPGRRPAFFERLLPLQGMRRRRLVIGSGLKATIIRTPLLLGPGTAGGRALLRSAASGSARVLGRRGRTGCARSTSDDLCHAILGYCRESGAGVRICGMVGPTVLTQRELLQQTARLLGHDLTVRSMPVRLGQADGRARRSGPRRRPDA